MRRDGKQTDMWVEPRGEGPCCLYCTGATMCSRGTGPRVLAGFPGSEQLSSFFNPPLPQHQAQVKVTSLVCRSAS